MMCPEHDEPFKLMCLDCGVITCMLCKEFGAHQGHRHDLIRNVASGQRDQLAAALSSVDALNELANARARAVEGVVSELGVASGVVSCGEAPQQTSTVGAAKQRIVNHFCDLHAAIDTRKEELLPRQNV